MNLKKELEKYFGFSEFRAGQEEIIRSILDGNDTLAVMPTGGGKSLCYQLPAILLEGTAIVISPLIALMKDQVDSLNNNSIPATFINSSLTLPELQERINNAVAGNFKLLYVAPERLENDYFIRILQNMKISFLAIDEAHCISEWGHDFRPAYLNINKALKLRPIRPIAAFTATAGPEVQEDIVNILDLKKANRFIRGFDRPNLSYHTLECKNKLEKVVEILKKSRAGSSVIYCGSRKRVDEISFQLDKLGFAVAGYHAGLTSDKRKLIQDDFIKGKKNIIVATNAFGMGIDKSDVRNVIHCDYTSTLEAYYQEAGRAGRDGFPSDCYMLYAPSDYDLQSYFIDCRYPDKDDIERLFGALLHYADTEGILRLKTSLLGNTTGIAEIKVSTILDYLERYGLISRSSKSAKAQIQIKTTRDELIDYYKNTTTERRDVITAIMRQVSSEAFSNFVEFNIDDLAKKYEIKKDKIEDTIRALSIQNIVDFKAEQSGGELKIDLGKASHWKNFFDFAGMDELKKKALLKLDVVIRYSETHECKRNFILNYFQDDEYEGECGRCTSCKSSQTKRNQKQKSDYLLSSVLSGLFDIDGRFGKQLLNQFLRGISNEKTKKYSLSEYDNFGLLSDASEYDVKKAIEEAESKRYIRVSSGLYPILNLTNEGFAYISKVKSKRELVPTDDEQNFIYAKLKNLRAEIASREGISERGVASDRALRLIAQSIPKNLKELTEIRGIGKYVSDKYGKLFLSVLNEQVADETMLQPEEDIDPNVKIIANHLEDGKSIDEIANMLKTDKGSIARIMQNAVANDHISLDWRLLISERDYNKLKQLIYSKPHLTLTKLKQSIVSNIDYAALRIAAAIVRKNL